MGIGNHMKAGHTFSIIFPKNFRKRANDIYIPFVLNIRPLRSHQSSHHNSDCDPNLKSYFKELVIKTIPPNLQASSTMKSTF